MEVVENKKLDIKVYKETLDNGCQVIIIPRKDRKRKYIIWATKYGSIDSNFIDPTTNQEMHVPDGVAHYLEHKMFEQENGVDSLYKMMSLGLNANAYTTTDHTAYLFSCSENFYEGLDELMDYFQHPYFTDENVEKERGIIGQEIQMYDDDPEWSLYINTLRCLYKNNPVRLDTAGTIETISHITKETLYSCYNTFYHPSNTIMCVSGDFEPNELLQEIKKRMLPREKQSEIKRIYPEYESDINQKYIEAKKDVNMPIFMAGYRDFSKTEINGTSLEKAKRDITVKMILDMLVGGCSDVYQKLYNEGLVKTEMQYAYETSDEYAHIVVQGESKEPQKVYDQIVDALQNNEFTEADFERTKKKAYGENVYDYDDVIAIGRTYINTAIQGIDTLDYITALNEIDYEYVKKVREEIFVKEKAVLSVVKPI